MAISELVNGNVCNLKPYSPGKPIEEVEREYGISNVVKLASNENPLGPSPKAVEAMKEAASKVGIYPDGNSYYLIKALAERLGVDEDMLAVGNGSDDLLHLIGITFLSPSYHAIIADTTFSRYESAAVLSGCCFDVVPLKNFRFDLDAMADKITDKTRLIFVCNPNNPTGTYVTQEEVDRFMARVPENVIVIFDEAYLEYVESADYPDTMKFVKEGKNVMVLRTFSKVYGLAGLRVGYAIARPELIQGINQVREPFNVNSIAQAAALVSIKDTEHVQRSRKLNSDGKKYLYGEFEAMGLVYTPTEANFIWVDIKQDCRPVFNELLKRGVIVRTGDIFGFPNYIRVTIGTEDQNNRFISMLKEVLG